MLSSVSRLLWASTLFFLGLADSYGQYTWNQSLGGEFRNDTVGTNTVLFSSTLSGGRYQTASAATSLQVNVVVPSGYTTGSGWTVKTSWTGGAADNNPATQSVALTSGVVGSPSAVVVSTVAVQGNRHRFAWRFTDQSGQNVHKVMSVSSSARPVIVEGSSSATLTVALHNPAGTVVDSCTITVNLSCNFNQLTGYTPTVSPTHTATGAPMVHLYYNGVVPPAGRAGLVPEYSDSLSGQVTNNDDEPQQFEIWADTDADGVPEKLWGIEVPPGATIPLNWGAELPEGVEPFVVTSGELSGFGTFSGGNESGRAGVYPPQEKEQNNVVILPDVTDLVPVGSADSKQDVLAPPAEGSNTAVSYEREYSGGYSVGSGVSGLTVTVIPASNGSPKTTIVAAEGATVAGTASNVQGVTSTIVTDSEGRNHSITSGGSGSSGGSRSGGIAGGNSTSGGSVSSGNSSQTGQVGSGSAGAGTSTSSNLVDKAAAQIAEIRAEVAGAMASIVGGSSATEAAEASGEGDATGEAGPFAGFMEQAEGMQSLRESLGLGEVLDTSAIPENPGFGTSKVVNVTVPGLNYTFNLDFDLPIIDWVRSILFAFVCVVWFFFMIRILKM